MKKTAALIITVLLTLGLLSACGGSGTEQNGDPVQIVTTIFPIYDWTREILGENPAGMELTMLLDDGVDLHSFQPSAEDIMKVSSCDLFVCVGGESDQWVEDAVEESVNEDQIQIRIMDAVQEDLVEEELIDGMQGEEEHGDEHEEEYDEHVWLSMNKAGAICGTIAETLAGLDPEHADLYRDNAEAYTGQLSALNDEYISAVAGGRVNTLLFGDRFPFRYMTEDYGLEYYAAFSGCSAETEASFETISFLADKVDELQLSCILTIDGSDQKIAETVRQNTETKDQKILTLNSLQAVTGEDADKGTTYLGIMKENLQVLKEALQ